MGTPQPAGRGIWVGIRPADCTILAVAHNAPDAQRLPCERPVQRRKPGAEYTGCRHENHCHWEYPIPQEADVDKRVRNAMVLQLCSVPFASDAAQPNPKCLKSCLLSAEED